MADLGPTNPGQVAVIWKLRETAEHQNRMRTVALIVAAGSGIRAGQSVPKQYQSIGGTPVLSRTIRAFLAAPGIDDVQGVIGDGQEPLWRRLGLADGRLRTPCFGGPTRQISVARG